MNNQQYMQYALELAKRGRGYVNPNPCVGAVIVKDNQIIGEGWHKKFGGPHAEVEALRDCKQSPKGATLFVTLEPCCHFGKTPPCTEAIITSGIQKVVIASKDANPLVAGKGIAILQAHGIEVVTGVLEDECKQLNEVFFHFIANHTPFVVMKYAMTLDGKIATTTGASKWITGAIARENVHKDRGCYTGIMVGVGTVLKDDPLLTCRLANGKNPIRIICDTHLRTPLSAKVVQTAKDTRTIFLTSCEVIEKQRALLQQGCEVLVVPKKEEHIDLNCGMQRLGEIGIDSILLEGGGKLNYAALESQIVHKLQAYIAPKIFGGMGMHTPVTGKGVTDVNSAYHLQHVKTICFGEDLMIEGEVVYTCLQEL